MASLGKSFNICMYYLQTEAASESGQPPYRLIDAPTGISARFLVLTFKRTRRQIKHFAVKQQQGRDTFSPKIIIKHKNKNDNKNLRRWDIQDLTSRVSSLLFMSCCPTEYAKKRLYPAINHKLGFG